MLLRVYENTVHIIESLHLEEILWVECHCILTIWTEPNTGILGSGGRSLTENTASPDTHNQALYVLRCADGVTDQCGAKPNQAG